MPGRFRAGTGLALLTLEHLDTRNPHRWLTKKFRLRSIGQAVSRVGKGTGALLLRRVSECQGSPVNGVWFFSGLNQKSGTTVAETDAPNPVDAAGSVAVTSSATGASISVTNSARSSGACNTNFPFLAIVRQEETWLDFRPGRSAT